MSDERDGQGRFVGRNPSVPGFTQALEPERYLAMRKALLELLGSHPDGLTQTEIRQALAPMADGGLFATTSKVDWWSKAVQLDLEARGKVVRLATKPLRWTLPR